ncbi:MAG: PhnA domain-containing protein [Marinifilaceae bacterium]|jgi:protein PhnA|nr:PhnA domain-containing protein [Marinifilaceae bacterium]
MELTKELLERCENKCELCDSATDLNVQFVEKDSSNNDLEICVCAKCKEELLNIDENNANYWRCLNTTMWSTVPAVQVSIYRLLNSIKSNQWAADMIDMMYLEDDVLELAKKGIVDEDDLIIHKDINGAVLNSGDTVVLAKDLNVKGGGFTAKRGTTVKNISLVDDNSEQIEGKINGSVIVILCKFVKKAN